ncbi:hypothetical protein B0H14DRAFT_3871990 [Mycena olivaceomarginata]|nr:hypothetical protein B0H14DRAFT_3871990 [Mycena olivaceomarginata]
MHEPCPYRVRKTRELHGHGTVTVIRVFALDRSLLASSSTTTAPLAAPLLFFARFLGSTFGDSNIISWPIPLESRRRSHTPPIFGPATARCSSGRCSHTAPLLAHLTADYTPVTDPAAARCPLPAYHLSSRTPPPLDHLHRSMHTFRLRPLPCRCLRTSPCCCSRTPPPLDRPPTARALPVARIPHRRLRPPLPAASQRMRTSPLLHAYPAAAYAPSPRCLRTPSHYSSALNVCPAATRSRAPPLHPYPAAALRPAALTPATRLSRRYASSMQHPAATRLSHMHVPNHVPHRYSHPVTPLHAYSAPAYAPRRSLHTRRPLISLLHPAAACL